jgi:predicted kinase
LNGSHDLPSIWAKPSPGHSVSFAVIVTGLPGAGKTTIGHPLARLLGLPNLRSDSIKEAIFDSTESGIAEWSEFLVPLSKQAGVHLSEAILDPTSASARPWTEFLTFVAKNIALDQLPEVGPCVFDVLMPRREAAERLPPLVRQIIEIHCSVSYEVAWRRVIARAKAGHRHPGHQDAHVSLEFFRESLRPQQISAPLDLGGPVLSLDTTVPVDLAPVCEWVQEQLARD